MIEAEGWPAGDVQPISRQLAVFMTTQKVKKKSDGFHECICKFVCFHYVTFFQNVLCVKFVSNSSWSAYYDILTAFLNNFYSLFCWYLYENIICTTWFQCSPSRFYVILIQISMAVFRQSGSFKYQVLSKI